jgi:hypothetical protein
MPRPASLSALRRKRAARAVSVRRRRSARYRDGMPEEPTTQELKAAQVQREAVERRQAEAAVDEEETAQHARRAEKAHYLREKLKEREESEQDS